MEYSNGTYLIQGHKPYCCEKCKQLILLTKALVRVKCFGPVLTRKHDGKSYQQKTYTRYHIDCAVLLPDLNEKEKVLLTQYFDKIRGENNQLTPVTKSV